MEEVLNDSDFDAKVLASDGKVLVEFFATWCPHCQRMQPILDDVAAKAAFTRLTWTSPLIWPPNTHRTGFPPMSCSWTDPR